MTGRTTPAPQMKVPPLKVVFSTEDRREIMERIDRCLETGFVAQGANVEEFEKAFAEYAGGRHAVAVSSGGAAIEVAMRAIGVEGQEVLCPTNTFYATAGGVLLAGGRVRLVDADPETFSVSVETLERAATAETAGVIVVHIGGIITPQMPEIRRWCEERGIWLFEDAAHAHGSALGGARPGSFGFGAAYSFFATKVMTSGEGGMLVTDDDELAERVRRLRNYGKPEPWITYCTERGANWRMAEFCAAVGVVQLRKLDEFVEWRARIADRYTRALADTNGFRPVLPAGRSSWYKYIVVLAKGLDRERVKAALKQRGVSVSGGVYDIPLHRQPVFDGTVDRFPAANEICEQHLCLPLYYGMAEDEASYVVEMLQLVLRDEPVSVAE